MARPRKSAGFAQASTTNPLDASPNAPLLTQENFEKELKALASKAREETTFRWVAEQSWILLRAAVLLSLAAIYANISLLTLSPVYGGYPSAIFHPKGVLTACFLGWSSNLYLKRYLPVRKPVLLLPVIAAYIPFIQYFLFQLSGFLGATYGPIVTEALTLLPLVFLSVACTATVLDDVEITSGRYSWVSDAAPGVLSFAFFKTVETLSSSFISKTIGQSVVQTRLGYQILLQGVYTLLHPSKLALWMIPALLHTALLNEHVPSPLALARLNTTMTEQGWALLERTESITGYVSVIENRQKDAGFRAMRCDHSILGGEWLGKPRGSKLSEPIYGVFVILEAVRLVETPLPIKDEDATALVM